MNSTSREKIKEVAKEEEIDTNITAHEQVLPVSGQLS
jgi:hypothetical protein